MAGKTTAHARTWKPTPADPRPCACGTRIESRFAWKQHRRVCVVAATMEGGLNATP